MSAISSKSNESVKFIRSLNEKKFRIKNKAFYLEGIKIANEIMDKAIDVMFIAYSKSLLLSSNGGKELLDRLETTNNKVIELEENIFKYITDTVTPQGVLIVLKMPEYNLNEILSSSNTNIVVLDKVQDLGNIGTIIRSSNAFDIDTIVCTPGTADVYSPKALRSTMGGILNIRIVYIEDITELELIKKKGYSLVTLSLDTNNSLSDIDLRKKYAFIMGNEANGVSKEVANMSDILVKIPMSNKIESLNVGVATSIVLYEQYKNR